MERRHLLLQPQSDLSQSELHQSVLLSQSGLRHSEDEDTALEEAVSRFAQRPVGLAERGEQL